MAGLATSRTRAPGQYQPWAICCRSSAGTLASVTSRARLAIVASGGAAAMMLTIAIALFPASAALVPGSVEQPDPSADGTLSEAPCLSCWASSAC